MLRCAITEGRLGIWADDKAVARLVGRCRDLAGMGVEMVIVREKSLNAGELVGVCRRVAEVGARVLVAGRVDVALAAGAAGVHLSAREGELRVGQVRQVMANAWVSVSCHTVEEVRRACGDGASMVVFAPVFGKVVDGVQVVESTGVGRLREACMVARAANVPVLALGGVTKENAAECMAAGASGVAGIRMFFG